MVEMLEAIVLHGQPHCHVDVIDGRGIFFNAFVFQNNALLNAI